MSAPRYLALAGKPLLRTERWNETALGMASVFSSGNLRVWATPEAIDLGGHGILIGHLFRRSLPSERMETLSSSEARRIIETDGASLMRDYWGGYVAFLRHADGRLRIVRDPSGTLPAYWRRMDGGFAVAPEVGPPPFSPSDRLQIDIEALSLHLWNPHAAGRRTCLAGVSEILPGEGLDIQEGRPTNHQLWSPWSYLPSRPLGVAARADALRETVIDAMKTWGDCFPSVLLGMSGGLDSTIVGAGLGLSRTKRLGVTMYALDGEGDERDYARIAAAALDIPLTCADYDSEPIDLAEPVASHVPRPFLAHYGQAIASVHQRFVRDEKIGAFFSGNGGDNTFCLMRSVSPVVDRIRSHAGPLATARTTTDVMRLTGADLPLVIRKVFERLRSGGPQGPGSGDPSWLEPERLANAQSNAERHPWHETPSGILPGAAAHVFMLRRAMGNDGLHSRAIYPPSISPLLAQPIVEHCLGIPSWFWVEGGVERSIARQAFRAIIPDALLDRQSKGGPSGFIHRLFHRKEGEVVEYLCHGVLRALGVIQPITERAVVARMSGDNPMLPQRLLALVAAEAWARRWQGD